MEALGDSEGEAASSIGWEATALLARPLGLLLQGGTGALSAAAAAAESATGGGG